MIGFKKGDLIREKRLGHYAIVTNNGDWSDWIRIVLVLDGSRLHLPEELWELV